MKSESLPLSLRIVDYYYPMREMGRATTLFQAAGLNINHRFIKYLTEAGFYKEKEFAFPHKQAALMKLEREAWETGPLL